MISPNSVSVSFILSVSARSKNPPIENLSCLKYTPSSNNIRIGVGPIIRLSKVAKRTPIEVKFEDNQCTWRYLLALFVWMVPWKESRFSVMMWRLVPEFYKFHDFLKNFEKANTVELPSWSQEIRKPKKSRISRFLKTPDKTYIFL